MRLTDIASKMRLGEIPRRLADLPLRKSAFYGAAASALSGLALGAVLAVPTPHVLEPMNAVTAEAAQAVFGTPAVVADAPMATFPPPDSAPVAMAAYDHDEAAGAETSMQDAVDDQPADYQPTVTDAAWTSAPPPLSAPAVAEAPRPTPAAQRTPPDPYLLRTHRVARTDPPDWPSTHGDVVQDWGRPDAHRDGPPLDAFGPDEPPPPDWGPG